MDKLNYYLLFVITVTFTVITLGAYVRLSHAGLGCPDWPGCYGFLIGVPDNAVEIAQAESAYEGSNVDIGKAWKEMIHRYLAGFLGIFIFIISYLFYKHNKNKLLVFLFCFCVSNISSNTWNVYGNLAITAFDRNVSFSWWLGNNIFTMVNFP